MSAVTSNLVHESSLADDCYKHISAQVRRKMDDSTSYDSVIIVDLDPPQNYPHASYDTIDRLGLEKEGKLKLSRNFRLRAIRLPIYEHAHFHHVIAKIDTRCTTSDKQNATRSVNEHIRNAKKANMTMDAVLQSVVETFPSRVVKGLNYDAHNEPISKFGTSSRRKINTQFSSSDTDGVQANHHETIAKKAAAKKKKENDPPQQRVVALPHNGDPTMPFRVIAPSPGGSSNVDIPDLMDVLGAQVTLVDEPETRGAEVPAIPVEEHVSVKEPPAKVRRINNDDIKALQERIDNVQNQVNSSLARIHKGILYLTGEVEQFREEYKGIASKLDDVIGDSIVKKMSARHHTFPFDSLQALEAYLEDDPQMTLLIER